MDVLIITYGNWKSSSNLKNEKIEYSAMRDEIENSNYVVIDWELESISYLEKN